MAEKPRNAGLAEPRSGSYFALGNIWERTGRYFSRQIQGFPRVEARPIGTATLQSTHQTP
jgi:hypothetical protein